MKIDIDKDGYEFEPIEENLDRLGIEQDGVWERTFRLDEDD